MSSRETSWANKRYGREYSETRKAINTINWAQSLGSPFTQVLINGGILSLFILALGGSNLAVGAAFTMNSFAQILRVFVASHVDVANRKKMVVFWYTCALLFGTGLLLAYPASVIRGDEFAVWLVVLFFLFERVSANIGAAAWIDERQLLFPLTTTIITGF